MGNIIVVTGPSGAGKTTLVDAITKADPLVRLSISYTSRAPRLGEVNGRHYHFITPLDFERRITIGEFIEYAKIYDNYYGTSKKWFSEQLNTDPKDILLEIDYQGLKQVQSVFSEVISVLILPPSFSELSTRLKSRCTESDDAIQHRLTNATEEIKALSDCRYIIFNRDLQQAKNDLINIVRAERLKTHHYLNILSSWSISHSSAHL
jgi:guanylate kinase